MKFGGKNTPTKVMKVIARKQETIVRNAKKRKRISPKNMTVGWTDKSGRYTEQRKSEAVTTNHKDGTQSITSKSILVKDVAKIHEYGLGNQTEKGFMRMTISQHKKKWLMMYRLTVLPWYVRGNRSMMFKALHRLGVTIRNDLKKSVVDIDLVDTGRLRDSILIEYKGR